MLNESSTLAHDLGDPGQAVPQDPLDPARERGGADGAGAARPLELDLDHAGLDIGPDQNEITPVGLHGGPHQVHDPLELVQAIGPLGVAQLGLGLGHPPILPCPARRPMHRPARSCSNGALPVRGLRSTRAEPHGHAGMTEGDDP